MMWSLDGVWGGWGLVWWSVMGLLAGKFYYIYIVLE